MLSGKGLGATGVGGAQNHGCRCVTKPRVPTWVCDRVAAWVGCQSRVRAGRLVVVRFVEGLEEWVSHSFGGQVGAWAVSWDDLDRACGIIKRQKILKDALHEEIIVAAGVVGTADGAGEERVAAEEDALVALEEAEAAA